MPAVAERTVQHVNRTNPATQAAIAAAVAAGMTQIEAAEHFKLHRNTVARICKDVRNVSNPANPLSPDYKPDLKMKAIRAVTKGLEHKRDPYKAANIGVKVLEGIGEFVGTQKLDVSGDVQLVVSWGQVDAIDSAIDITPEAESVHKVESLPESTDVTESTS